MRDLNIAEKPTFLLSLPSCNSDCEDIKIISNDVESGDPCFFQVAWSINPHMKIGSTNIERAIKEHHYFRKAIIEAGASVIEVPFVHGAFDSVFVKDNGILKKTSGGVAALLGRPKMPERKKEQRPRHANFEQAGIDVIGITKNNLEGGDVVVHPNGNVAFMGYGFRTDQKALDELSKFLGARIVSLELVDPKFYHLDVCFSILSDGIAFACKEAFSDNSWKKLTAEKSIDKLIEVPMKEALQFGLNFIQVDDTIISGSYSPMILDALAAARKRVVIAPLTQFQLAGGSAACLTAPIYQMENFCERISRKSVRSENEILVSVC
ncbi:MAG: arginine deiminase family protein [Bdellovibrionota bacterium]